jgi:hypothetical protein
MAYFITTQCHMTLNVVACCVPTLKPFMDRATSGFMAASLGQREGTYNASGSSHIGSFPMHVFSKRSSKPKDISKGGTSVDSRPRFHPAESEYHTMVLSGRRGAYATESQAIQKSVDFDVQYSDEAHLNPVHHHAADEGYDDVSMGSAPR